jgi:hypothetical protein
MARASNSSSKSKTVVNIVNINDVLIGIIVILVVCVIIKECKNNKQARIEAFYKAEAEAPSDQAPSDQAPSDQAPSDQAPADPESGENEQEQCIGNICWGQKGRSRILIVCYIMLSILGAILLYLVYHKVRNYYRVKDGKDPIPFRIWRPTGK